MDPRHMDPRHMDPGDTGSRDTGSRDRASRPGRALRSDRASRPDGAARPDRSRRAVRRERPAAWADSDAFGPDTDTELPPWAGLSVHPTMPGGTRLRPPAPADDYRRDEQVDPWDGEEPPAWPDEPLPPRTAEPAPRPRRRYGRRAAAARLRRSRRRVYRWCGLAIAACVVAAVITVAVTHHPVKSLPYVTTLLRGEFKSVPDSCKAISPAVLNQYLPPAGRTTVQSTAGATDSQCTFTVDSKPNFLVLSVQAQSYQPFPAASGDGSASDNALDNFVAARLLLAQPPKKSPLPPATITPLAGLGKQAFMAVAREHVGHIVTDVVTVAILDRNVIITVALSGEESGGGFGPVSMTTLQAGAHAAASSVLTKVTAQPTA